MLVSITGCSDPASKIEVTPKLVTRIIGETQTFSAVNPDGAVKWSSSDPSIATISATGVATAIKFGTITITATDKHGSASASLTAIRPSLLLVSKKTVELSLPFKAGYVSRDDFKVSNGGDDPLGYLTFRIKDDTGKEPSWLQYAFADVHAPTTISLTAQALTLPVGSYHATITVFAGGEGQGEEHVDVVLNITTPPPPPVLTVSGNSFEMTYVRGATVAPTQTVQISNAGASGSDLSGLTTYSENPWFNPTLSSTSAPATLTIQLIDFTKPVGRYHGNVVVVSGNQSRSIEIWLNVVNPN